MTSVWGLSDASAKVKTQPMKMPSAPRRGPSTDIDTLHVIWDPIHDDSLTGGSQIIYYSIYKEGEDESIFQTQGTSYLYERSDPMETRVRFQVAASNIYGTGELSGLSDPAIEFGSVPS